LVKKYGIDPLRYFLLREITPTEDGDFTYEKFEQRYNSDLAKGLGNLVSRVANLAKKHSFPSDLCAKGQVQKEIAAANGKYQKALSDFKFNEALISIWELIGFCDQYIEKKRPWEDKESSKEVIMNLLVAVAEVARLLAPFMPQSSEGAKEQLKSENIKALFPRI
jgi:methionyl-tRNA synthetase